MRARENTFSKIEPTRQYLLTETVPNPRTQRQHTNLNLIILNLTNVLHRAAICCLLAAESSRRQMTQSKRKELSIAGKSLNMMNSITDRHI